MKKDSNMKICRFADFTENKTKGGKMFENENVAVVDMRDEAKHHIREAVEKLKMAADAVYELKRMADYVKIDFPKLSHELGSHAETVLEEIDVLEKKVEKTIDIIK